MKKFTETVGVIRELNEKELSELQKSYRDYFGAKMKKFGVKSPAELSEEKKKEFFNEITKDWEKGKGATETGKKDVEEHGSVKESFEINEDNKSTAKKLVAKLIKGNPKFTWLKTELAKDYTLEDVEELLNKYGYGSEYEKNLESVKESENTNIDESALLIAGGILLAIVGIKALRDIGKAILGKIGMSVEPGKDKLKEVINTIYDESACCLSSADKPKAELWKSEMLAKIDSEEITNLKGIDAALSNTHVFEYESTEESEEISEAKINEKDIKSAADFKAFAEDKLKKQHGDDYDQDKADKVIKGLSDEAEKSGDWGAAIGKLNKA